MHRQAQKTPTKTIFYEPQFDEISQYGELQWTMFETCMKQ